MKRTRKSDMPRTAYIALLARMVMAQRITASQSVVLSYRYDHPGATLDEACAAMRVPVACCADIANI